ncbi:MAG: hypothetical protein LBS66_04135 [Rhodospirillaceae bacterium]|jgi:hypothetical protein|nr:hypothetical protein [Rhodospirillaceae bacterium]
MTRILIEYIFPLLLPIILWLLWIQYKIIRSGQKISRWQPVPISWLLATGVFLALLFAIGSTLHNGYSTGRYYQAYVDDNGRLTPSGFK